jgi:trk system potassium uptake protein TrkH
MNFFDSLIHALSTTSTGGSSTQNLSIGYYKNLYIEIILSIFMILSSINFNIYFSAIEKDFKFIFRNDELQFYFFILILSIIIICLDINKIYHSYFLSLRYSVFNVISIISTTGYSISDINYWPSLSKFILSILMIFGACAGSTSGGLKLIRFLLIIKLIKREIDKLTHPKLVKNIEINDTSINEKVLYNVLIYFIVFIFTTFFIALCIIIFEKKDISSSISVAISTLNNVGVCFGEFSLSKNFVRLSTISKLLLSVCMIAGRLEIYPIILLFSSLFKNSK